MEGRGRESSQPHKTQVKDFWVLELCDESEWEPLSPLLSLPESRGWKCFFPRCRPALGPALRGETLPKLGQAAQKQMRSDTGAKECLPEPLQAHITKCSTLRSLGSVSTLHAEITDTERGRLVKMPWMNACNFSFVCLWKEAVNKELSVRAPTCLCWSAHWHTTYVYQYF